MAYVQPNSIIQLFQGINLDNRYLHTIYFASEAAQNTWFTGKVFKSYQQQSYTRYTRNQIKIKDDVTNLFGCTYMRFKNDRTVDKWFYAFVTGVDYVNEGTALVTYEIDVMQTWFMQGGSLQPCMVLREHVNDDTFGLNLEEEPIGSDVYDSDLVYNFGSGTFDDYSVVMQTTGSEDMTDHHMIQGLFSGCTYRILQANSQGQGNNIYNRGISMLGSWSLQEQQENIIDLYTVPTFCCGENTGHLHVSGEIEIPSAYDNYTPKNKKLFMFPYSYLMVTTHMGDVAIFRWEYFEGTTGADCEFEVDGTMLGGGEIRCYPRAYNGQDHNVDAGVVMGNFPKNTAAYDAYQAWIAGGGSTRLENDRRVNSVKGAGGVMKAIGSIANMISPSSSSRVTDVLEPTGTRVNGHNVLDVTRREVSDQYRSPSSGAMAGAVGGALSTAGELVEAKNNMQYEFNDAAYAPNIIVGAPTSCLPVSQRDANIYFYHTHVRDDEVKRIDDFFSCYGYSIKKVKQPNLTGRKYWNFVQTQGAVINGNMPASSKDAIARIFDSGITFWHNGDKIGDYAQSVTDGTINNPISS